MRILLNHHHHHQHTVISNYSFYLCFSQLTIQNDDYNEQRLIPCVYVIIISDCEMDGERDLCKKNVTTISQFSLQFSSRRCRRQPYFNTHACQCEKFIHKTEAFHGFVYRKKSFSFLSKINFDFIDFSSVFINISLQLCL